MMIFSYFKITVIHVFILYSCASLTAQEAPQYSIIKEGRENNITPSLNSQDLANIFHKVRYQASLQNPIDSIPPSFKNTKDDILSDLIQAEHLLKGEIKKPSDAYQYYLEALDKSVAIQDTSLICETLKRILNFYIFSNKDRVAFSEFLELHKSYAYDRIEELYNIYFDMRADHQYAIAKGQTISIPQSRWTSLINECHNSKYFRLETEFKSIYGVYLELHEKDFMGAQQAYESSILSAQKVDSITYARIQFAALANIGAMLHSINKPTQALSYLVKASALKTTEQQPENQVYIYNWLSDVYKDLNNPDSALLYLKKAYDTNKDFELNKHAISVQEVQEKYQNESLKVELMNTELQKGRYILIAWLLFGGLLMATMAYILSSRISRLNKLNLQQKLENTEKESQLKAINATIDGEEAERRRIASVLHDNISTHLAASRLHLGVFKKRNNIDDSSLNKTDSIIAEISTQVRKLSHELYPPTLYQLGLLESLKGLSEKYSTEELAFEITGDLSQIELHPKQSIKLYFVVHELINNVIKHSKASTCIISARHQEGKVVINIQDNGKGGISTLGQQANSLGLYTVKARIENMSGQVIIDSPLGQGTVVKIIVPVDQNKGQNLL